MENKNPKIKRVVHYEEEISKYEVLITYENHLDFMDIIGADSSFLEVFYNLNNSGNADFYNFLNAEEVYFETVEDIEEKAKELGKPYWTVISFYRENGWDGVYSRTGEEALTRKCNNWVNQGRDGYLFVVFATEQGALDEFEDLLQEYLNYGCLYLEIYDNEADDYIPGMPLLGVSRDAAIDFIADYGLTAEDFDKALNNAR